MSNQVKSVSWNTAPIDSLVDIEHQLVDFLIVELEPKSVADSAEIGFDPTSEVIAFRDSSGTSRWSRLNSVLPTPVYFLAVVPSKHAAIGISTRLLEKSRKWVEASQSWDELIVRLSASSQVSFIDNVSDCSLATCRVPPLTMLNAEAGPSWLCDMIYQLPASIVQGSATDLASLKAGLFLLNDFFDESHSCSQSIEGLGKDHTGDYWHAILHRREPDYGNAKYWFRHVGRHPSFKELAKVVHRHFAESKGSLAGILKQWQGRLLSGDIWNPTAFVDLCAAAENDSELQSWCEQVQYDEMLLLLLAASQK